jgi:hypothetical protein
LPSVGGFAERFFSGARQRRLCRVQSTRQRNFFAESQKKALGKGFFAECQSKTLGKAIF